MDLELTPAQRPHVESRIIDAAAQLFLRWTPHAVCLEDVAAEAGVPITAVHDRFADTAEVLGALVERTFDSLSLWSTPPGESSSPETRLLTLTREHLQMINDHEDLAAVIILSYEHLAEPFRTGFRRRAAIYRARWIPPIQQIAPHYPDRRLDAFVMGLLEALNAAGLRTGHRDDAEAEAAAFTRFALRTLRDHQNDIEGAFSTIIRRPLAAC